MGRQDGWAPDDRAPDDRAPDDWADTTGSAPGSQQPGYPVQPSYDEWSTGPSGPQGPRPHRSAGGRPGVIVAGTVAVVVVIGLVAAVAFLLLGRDQAPEPVAGAGASEENSAPAMETGGVPADGAGADSASADEAGAGSATVDEAGADSASAAGTDQATGASAGSELAPTAGTYSGMLSQRGTRRSDRDYPVVMTFSSQGSTVEYPTLGCRGTLTPTGTSDGARIYRESITSGRCDPAGTWYVTKGSATAVSAEYRPSGDSYVVVGQLTR